MHHLTSLLKTTNAIRFSSVISISAVLLVALITVFNGCRLQRMLLAIDVASFVNNNAISEQPIVKRLQYLQTHNCSAETTARSLFLVGNVHEHQDNLLLSIAYYQSAQLTSSIKTLAQFKQANLHYALENRAVAFELWSEAGAEQFLQRKGIALRNEHHLAAARQFLEAAVTIDPKLIVSHYYLALIATEEGNWQEAIERASLVVKQKPTHLQALILIGNNHRQLGNYHLADEWYRKVAEINDGNHISLSLKLLGINALSQGELELAIEHFNRSLQVSPEHQHGELYYYLATTYGQLGEPQTATFYFERAHDANPSNQLYFDALANNYLMSSSLGKLSYICARVKDKEASLKRIEECEIDFGR